MKRFERIHIKGFRRLRDVKLELKPFCVLIGANGSGKTSLLDELSLLSASASGKLKDWISDASGINANLTSDDAARQMSFELSMEVPDHNPLIYKLSLAPTGVAYEIAEESLTQQRDAHSSPFKLIESRHGDIRYFDVSNNALVRPTWEHNSLETSLAQVPKMFQEPEEFRSRLASSTHYHVLNVDSRAPVRQPQPLRPADLPGRDGEDLVSCLFSMRETDRDRFEAVEDTLRAGFSDFERLDFPPRCCRNSRNDLERQEFFSPVVYASIVRGHLAFSLAGHVAAKPRLDCGYPD